MCRSVSRVSLVLGLGVLLALAPLSVIAARPIDHIRQHEVFLFTDPDFCGVGLAVDVAVDQHTNVFIYEDGLKDLTEIKVTFTNPETGASVVLHIAGPFILQEVENPDGTTTITTRFPGLQESIRRQHGPLLSRDAGIVEETIVLAADGTVISYDSTWVGPHPEAESEFTLFCEVVLAELTT